jgi:hypothetical protein
MYLPLVLDTATVEIPDAKEGKRSISRFVSLKQLRVNFSSSKKTSLGPSLVTCS